MPFRNIETHFSQAPQAKIKRSSFKYNKPVKTTFNAGDLVPFLVEEVLPGDTFDLKLSKVIRLLTPLHPTMDNLYLDTYFFFVPNRFIWDNWTKFMGESDKAWVDPTVHVPPKFLIGGASQSEGVSFRLGKLEPQSILNYLGIPSYTEDSKQKVDILALPFNRYCKVWNDWFRSENLCDVLPIYTGDGDYPLVYLNGYNAFMNSFFGGTHLFQEADSCLKVAKFADYFTRALPQPQKGADVLIPAGGLVEMNPDKSKLASSTAGFRTVDSQGNISYNPGVDFFPYNYGSAPGNMVVGDLTDPTTPTNTRILYDPKDSLVLNGLEITVNNLRLAMQTQKLLERDARGGTRYIELIKSHFNVISPDLRLQRSEYLGGKRTLINMSEVIQTSESTTNSPMGNLAGRSITTGIEDSFIKSFTEHGYIIGVMCVRPDRTYSQGLEKSWFRFNRLDYYFPVLANIGEMPVLNREIYMPNKGESVAPDEVFGYQEAWSEYRTQKGRNTGFMQPGISGSLSSWTYGDNYTSTPMLSSEWLYQGKSEIDATLAVPSSTAPQFIADLLVYGKAVRPMPVYSIPGLVDHN